MKRTDEYKELEELQYRKSTKYKQMPKSLRAAQFAPFAALSGHSDVLKETARITSEPKELDEQMKDEINTKLCAVRKEIDNRENVSVTFFEKDRKKKGGRYVTVRGVINKIDKYSRTIVLDGDIIIRIDDIISFDVGEVCCGDE